MIGIEEDEYLVIRHCVVHHWVEVARVVVVHYSYLLHMSVIACFTDFTDVYRCLQMVHRCSQIHRFASGWEPERIS